MTLFIAFYLALTVAHTGVVLGAMVRHRVSAFTYVMTIPLYLLFWPLFSLQGLWLASQELDE